MDFELDAAQLAWLTEVREFLEENVTGELRAELAQDDLEFPDGEVARFRRKIGEKGWFGLNWPREYGGLGARRRPSAPVDERVRILGCARTRSDRHIGGADDHAARHRTKQNRMAAADRQRRNDLRCRLFRTEAGTDLASLRTRASRDGDEWVINGTKLWNSGAQRATHEWLCVRTDPNDVRHQGLSVIIVPIDSPGVEIRPLYAWSGYRTNEVHFRDVRVPMTNLVGEVNRGWTYITGALDLERGALTNAGDLRRAVEELRQLSMCPRRDGTVPAHSPSLRRRPAQAEADIEVATLMGYEAPSILDSGVIPSVQA